MKPETRTLANLLAYAKTKDAEGTAEKLLARFGSLSSLLSSDRAELIDAGLSPRAALLLSLAASIPARAAEAAAQSPAAPAPMITSFLCRFIIQKVYTK